MSFPKQVTILVVTNEKATGVQIVPSLQHEAKTALIYA
jgi:hypothetical protein